MAQNDLFNSEEYNKQYFYRTFETKIKWILGGMVFSLLFKDGWMVIVCLAIYMCYGLYKKAKIEAEIEQLKNNPQKDKMD